MAVAAMDSHPATEKEQTPSERSDMHKAAANEAFKRGDHKLAIKKYGFALKHAERAEEGQPRPDTMQTNRTATVLANRCMAHMALGDTDAALTDATAATKAAPGWPKAYFRLGNVLMAKGAHVKAYAAFKQGWHFDMTNEELTKACQQAHQAMVGLKREDKVMTNEDLVKMRSGKLMEQWNEKTEQQKKAAAPLMAVAAGAPVADLSYREEALLRTVKMANPTLPEQIAAREAAVAEELEAEAAEKKMNEEKAAAEAAAAVDIADAAAKAAAAEPVVPPAVTAGFLNRPPKSAAAAAAPAAKAAPAASSAAAAAAAPAAKGVPAAPASASPSMPVPEPPAHEIRREALADSDSEELVICIRLPLLSSIKEVELSVSSEAVELAALDASLYAPLMIALPAAVDDDACKARFDKKARVLTVRLPVVPGVVV